MNPNVPTAVVAVIFVGAVGNPWLTAVAMLATVAGGFVIARRRQVRSARLDRVAALNYQTSRGN